MNYIDIPDEFRIHKEIPLEKFASDEIAACVEKLIWSGNIKSSISGISKSLTDAIRYEEIQLIHCTMKDRGKIYDVGHCIYKAIKYPCIIEFQIDEATTIGVCEFQAGKIDRDRNVLHSLCFSHWLHKDILSPQAQIMIDRINIALRKVTNMADVYGDVRKAIIDYNMKGTSKAHVDRIIHDLIGKGKISPNRICKYCQPYKYYAIIPGNTKYSAQSRANTYTLVYDYEEIWYCLMKCPETRTVIEGRRYRDIEDLIYSVDSKGW